MENQSIVSRPVRRKKIKAGEIVKYTLVILSGFVMLYLFLFALAGSVTTEEAFEKATFFPALVQPFQNLSNYILIFKVGGLLRSFLWTVARILLYFVVVSFTSVLAGYVFAKLEFKFKRSLFLFLLSSLMIPGVAMLVPNFIWMAKFPLVGGNDITGNGGNGFIDNPLFMLITGWVNVYFIFLCRQAFLTLDDALGESASIDGAGFFTTVFYIYMPLIKPILAVIMINTATGMWNDYMTCFVYMQNTPEWQTIGTTISTVFDSFVNPLRDGGADYPKAMAVSIVTMIPPVIIYCLMQKSFVEGLAMGGVKG